MSDDPFADFPYTTSKEWLAQIAKDLKGRSLTEMNWSPDGDLITNPFVHTDDVLVEMPSILSFGQWQIGESFVVNDAIEANQHFLEALSGGVESLHISCEDSVHWKQLFANVELSFIHLGLDIHGDVDRAFSDFLAYASTRCKPDELRVTLLSKNLDTHTQVRFCTARSSSENIADGLASVMLGTLESLSFDPVQLTKGDLSVTIGMHYLIEIARLRALRILWTNLASALKFSVSPAFAIEAYTKECSTNDDPYTHMIRSTVMGLAAVLGGADRIYIQPSVGANHSESFYRHVARNIHHLLRMESKFTEINDPVTGAYYLDNITKEIVEKAWEELLKRIKDR